MYFNVHYNIHMKIYSLDEISIYSIFTSKLLVWYSAEENLANGSSHLSFGIDVESHRSLRAFGDLMTSFKYLSSAGPVQVLSLINSGKDFNVLESNITKKQGLTRILNIS